MCVKLVISAAEKGLEPLQAGGLGLLDGLLPLLLGAAVEVQAPDRAGQPPPGCALCICQTLHSGAGISAMQLKSTGQLGLGGQGDCSGDLTSI